ncbi:MAG TPA: hypothetical protein VF631_01075 [Allosphingosinicella sp.]|jgi:outer membrane biosynthesis protein TonB|uniref:hypothetical protein n=1 Tax=Allosphingosinicella sp. TaxID=2823234 RepID=UPI002F2784B3
MRLWSVTAIAFLAAAGCGGGGDQTERTPRGGGELTVTLPPTLPTEPAAQEAEPEAGFETIAAVGPAAVRPEPPKIKPAPKQPEPRPKEAPPQVEVAVAPAAEPAAGGEAAAAAAETSAPEAPAATAAKPPESRPSGGAGWATYIRKAGFPCRRVTSTDRVERAAGTGLQYYRVQCEGGGSYQATNKRGHLYFRRWRG